MNIEIHGTGRAAGALAISAARAGHRVVGIHGRGGAVNPYGSLVTVVDGDPDLRIIAVSDRAIRSVADSLTAATPVPTVHVSGAEPVSVLDSIADRAPVGSFHPLQTLPTPEAGANRLPGAWVGITAEPPLDALLFAFAESMGCTPFHLSDDRKATYHAAAAAVANFPLASFAIAADLYEQAGVPYEAARTLLDAIVANAFDLGPREALTGPIARGDVETVSKPVGAVRSEAPDLAEAFLRVARATADIAGVSDEFEQVLR